MEMEIVRRNQIMYDRAWTVTKVIRGVPCGTISNLSEPISCNCREAQRSTIESSGTEHLVTLLPGLLRIQPIIDSILGV